MYQKIGAIVFSSDFDSGNLSYVEQVLTSTDENADKNWDLEFNLRTSPDAAGTVYENGNRTWFYFCISGPLSNKRVKFNIQNMNKQVNLFTQGMSPVFKVLPSKCCKWQRIKERTTHEMVEGNFCLSFTHMFTDVTKYTQTFFAFTYPHSYKECQDFINQLETEYSKDDHSNPDGIYFHRDVLCYSNDGLNIDLLTVTSNQNMTDLHEKPLLNLFPDQSRKRARIFKNKKLFFLTARVHPGETPSSHVFNGFLKFLLRKDDQRSMVLRKSFVFKMVPMLNPDGVKRGHYRTDSTGVNLNRVYDSPDVVLHPSIYALKQLMIYHHHNRETNISFSNENIPNNDIIMCDKNNNNDVLQNGESDVLQGFPPNIDNSKTCNRCQLNQISKEMAEISFKSTYSYLKRSQTEPNISLFKSSSLYGTMDSQAILKINNRLHQGTSDICINKDSYMIPCPECAKAQTLKKNTRGIPDKVLEKSFSNKDTELDSKIDIFIDLHGHASKRGCFIYGNYFENDSDLIKCMLLPKLISLNSSYFDFSACNFSEKNMHHRDKRDGQSKEGSARVAMYKTLGVIHSYTLECNYNNGKGTNQLAPVLSDNGQTTPPPSPGFPPRYTPGHYEEVGRAVAIATLDLYGINPWSRLPLSEYKTVSGVEEWLSKFLKGNNLKSMLGIANRKDTKPLKT